MELLIQKKKSEMIIIQEKIAEYHCKISEDYGKERITLN